MSNQNLSKFSVVIDNLILKCVWRSKEPRILKAILKNKSGVFRPPVFKPCYKATVMKRMQFWHKNQTTH